VATVFVFTKLEKRVESVRMPPVVLNLRQESSKVYIKACIKFHYPVCQPGLVENNTWYRGLAALPGLRSEVVRCVPIIWTG